MNHYFTRGGGGSFGKEHDESKHPRDEDGKWTSGGGGGGGGGGGEGYEKTGEVRVRSQAMGSVKIDGGDVKTLRGVSIGTLADIQRRTKIDDPQKAVQRHIQKLEGEIRNLRASGVLPANDGSEVRIYKNRNAVEWLTKLAYGQSVSTSRKDLEKWGVLLPGSEKLPHIPQTTDHERRRYRNSIT